MFRFTIRELVLLTIIVAIGVAWWVDRSQLAASNAASLRMLAETLKSAYEEENPAKRIEITVNGGGISTITEHRPIQNASPLSPLP